MAISAWQHENLVRFQTTTAIISAIIHTGNVIAAASTGNSSPGNDKLVKAVDSLRDLLMPELKEDTERQAASVKQILAHEFEQGPLKVRAMARDKTRRGRVKRKRTPDADHQ